MRSRCTSDGRVELAKALPDEPRERVACVRETAGLLAFSMTPSSSSRSAERMSTCSGPEGQGWGQAQYVRAPNMCDAGLAVSAPSTG